MPERFTYLLIDAACIVFPFASSFHPKIRFDKQWKYFLPSCLVTAFLFLIWDYFFTLQNIWSFNVRYISGVFLFHLPVEECLFFICVTYACVFTYYTISLFLKPSHYNKAANYITWALVLSLGVTGLLNLPRLYTSITFLSLAAFLLLLLVKRVTYLSSFFVSYLIILIPFFISNGILTGSGLDEPVVSYNNHYNLGIRMFTIPLEDTFYGMLLILMNVAGFEYLRKIKAKHVGALAK